jgi:ABC-type branched-subunit amino acid transport system ATPase component
MFLAILIVGGMGTYLGPILGGVLLYVLPEQLQKLNEYRLLTYGIVLLLFIVFLPGGLVSIPEKIRLMLNKNKSINAMAENAKIPDEESKLLIQNMTVDLGLEKIEENKEILVIDNMHKYFSGVKAVNGVSIKVKSNTIHALIGPNGSGKTTLLDTISNIYSITSGKVYLKDEDITNVKPHILVSCGLCRTFQISQVFKHLTVLENVVIGQNHWRKTGFLHGFLNLKFARNEEAISKDYAEKVLKFVGLSEYINIKAGELPYGLQRILEIARALASKPILLMLDEPAAGMNPRESEQLLELLKRIKQLGVTIMLIEHNMQLVMKVSDYITVLDYGQVIAEGKPSDIQSNRRVIETYLGKSAVSVI